MTPFERIQALEKRVAALEPGPLTGNFKPIFQDTNPNDNPNAGKATGPWMPDPTPLPKKAPGYIAFLPPNPPSVMIAVDGGGMLPSVEDWLQITVQQMAGGPGELNEEGVSSLLWTDDQARVKLQNVADDRGAWLGDVDPNTEPTKKALLREKYVKAFRVAVTPV